MDLRLLDEVSWRGTPLPQGRTQALLASLVVAGGQVSEERLVDEVWGPDDVPANPAKALQVVVSRARSQTAPDVVARTDHGYRLGLPAGAVDALVLRDAVVGAREAEGRHDLVRARDLAREALALPAPGSAAEGPVGELRLTAARHREIATMVLGRTLSALGDHQEALPLLEQAESDEASVAALLRSTAAVHGAPAALERYERHRHQLADRLGVDPGPALQAVYADLLASDSPVREGLLFESTSLVGRDEDIRALRATVREARVTSILGPGGLGKTRLAHLLGREAEQPVVHFVELVGVASPEDVVGEVGSALGVRDSVSGRRVLTAEQRNDVRARIAQLLDQAPTLLILDNCEHVVEAVAELVAFLVASCRQLRVVTTTRAPLAIAAERVFPLGQLSEDAAADLFVAARLGGAAGRTPRRRGRTPRRTPPRRAAAGDRARRRQGAGDVGRGHRPPARRPVRAAARRRPQRARPAPDPDRGHRLVVEPAHRGRAPGAALAVGLPRRLHPRRGRTSCSAATRWTLVQSLVDQSLLTRVRRTAGRSATGCSRPSASSAGCSWSARARTAPPTRRTSPGRDGYAGEQAAAALVAATRWRRCSRLASGGEQPRRRPPRRGGACPTRRPPPSSPLRWAATGRSGVRTPG